MTSELTSDTRGAVPVVGIILIVALVVILTAGIGSTFFSLIDGKKKTADQEADRIFEYDSEDGVKLLSFEDGTVGDTTPPNPWESVYDPQEGAMELRSSRATNGSVALYISGSGFGTNDNFRTGQNVGVELDLTDVETVKFDVYKADSDNSYGEINVHVAQNGNHQVGQGFTQKPDGWHNDSTIDVSSVSGEAMLIFHADGSDNKGYIDNIRFYDAQGDRVSA